MKSLRGEIIFEGLLSVLDGNKKKANYTIGYDIYHISFVFVTFIHTMVLVACVTPHT